MRGSGPGSKPEVHGIGCFRKQSPGVRDSAGFSPEYIRDTLARGKPQ